MAFLEERMSLDVDLGFIFLRLKGHLRLSKWLYGLVQ